MAQRNSIQYCIIWGFLALTLAGCVKVGPNFSRPKAPCKHEWIETVDTSETPICYWWKTFNDPILDGFIESAYQENLSLRIACYRILEARARLGIAVGEFFPQVQEGIGSVTRTGLSKHAPNIGPFPDLYFKDYQLGFQAAWELDFWGKYRRAIESEQATLCAAYANYDNVLVLLLADVASVYVQIRATEELIQIVRANIKIQERGLEIAKAQFEGGFVSELDVQQATTLLRDTQARLPDLEREHRQTQNALCVLLGLAPQDLEARLQGPGKIPSTSSKLVINMPESLLYRRPDIRQALQEAAAQSARVGVAFADFFPQISLTGIIAYQSSNSDNNVNASGGKLLDQDSLSFNYGAGFAWPLLNYGRITSRVNVARARFYQLVVNYQNVVLQAYRDVEDSLVGFVKSEEQVGFLSDSVKAAERSLDLSKTQYVEGMVDYTRVLDTQRSFLEEAERHTLARSNAILSLIGTYKALGGGWEIRHSSSSPL